MKYLKVNLKPPYYIYIGKDVILKLRKLIQNLELGNYGIVITTKNIYSLYKKLAKKVFSPTKNIKFAFRILPDTEKVKSLFYLSKFLNTMKNLSFKKRVFFLCWGGGVIGDFGGFIASIYKRGSPYIQIPTTLLAQIDSSIGGKTAIDLKTGKNLIGCFWQPRIVLTDIGFLKTLSISQIKEGLAEAIKYGLIKDGRLFKFIEERYENILKREENLLLNLIYTCVKIKKRIIEEDEREEKGIRTVLNFGHTIAHGIEAASNYRISHGKAVSLGIISALHVSLKEKILKNKEVTARTERLLKNIGLPLKIKIDKRKVMQAIKKDKKFIRGKTRMVLLENIGRVRIKEEIETSTILEGVKKVVTS